MKPLITLIFGITIYSISYAQKTVKKGSLKSVNRNHTIPPPLLIIKSKGNTYEIDTFVYSKDLLNHIDPKWIDSIAIIKPSKGFDHIQQANNGQIIIVLNDKRYPNAFKIIEMYLKKIQNNSN